MDINKFMTTDNTITPNYFIEQIRLKDKEKRELINIASIHWKQWIINALNAGIAAYPEVVKVEWCQYTPNFNDGDTCRFSVHDPIFYNAAGEEIYEDEINDAFEDFLNLYDEKDIVLNVFDDHQQITFENGQLTNEWYEHH